MASPLTFDELIATMEQEASEWRAKVDALLRADGIPRSVFAPHPGTRAWADIEAAHFLERDYARARGLPPHMEIKGSFVSEATRRNNLEVLAERYPHAGIVWKD